MIWLDAMTDDGSILYLDVHRTERSRRRGGMVTSVVATLGDGPYEGEVLVEMGSRTEVVFVDEWLGDPEVARFLRRVDRMRLEEALGEALQPGAAGNCDAEAASCCPHHGGGALGNRSPVVAETAPAWALPAA